MPKTNKEETIYCVYCGHDKSEKHSQQCSLIVGIPKAVIGFYPKQNDNEWNLNLGRMSILTTIRPIGGKLIICPLDEKIVHRLGYEFISFSVRRFNMKWSNSRISLKIPILKNIYGWRYRKEFENLKRAANVYGVTDKEFNEILNEKVLLANFSGKEMLPFYRNTKTGRLIYREVE